MTSKVLNFMKPASKWTYSVCEEEWLPQNSSLWTPIKHDENTSKLYFLCGIFQNAFLKAVFVFFPNCMVLPFYCILSEKTRMGFPGVLTANVDLR